MSEENLRLLRIINNVFLALLFVSWYKFGVGSIVSVFFAVPGFVLSSISLYYFMKEFGWL